MKNSKTVIIAFMLSLSCILTMTSCKKKDKTIVVGDDTEIVSPDKGLSITDDTMDTLILQFMQGKLNNTDDVSWATSSLRLDPADKTSDNTEVIDKYSNRNALYVKIHDITNDEYYNIRFQMNEENKVESYIRFQLMY